MKPFLAALIALMFVAGCPDNQQKPPTDEDPAKVPSVTAETPKVEEAKPEAAPKADKAPAKDEKPESKEPEKK